LFSQHHYLKTTPPQRAREGFIDLEPHVWGLILLATFALGLLEDYLAQKEALLDPAVCVICGMVFFSESETLRDSIDLLVP